MNTIALILAAGRGLRATSGSNGTAPKQYVPLAGKAVLQHTIDRFAFLPEISRILVVIHPEDHDLYGKSVANKSKLLPVAEGAETRQGSVLAGLCALESQNPDRVLIHDAARMLVDHYLILRVLAALDDNQAVVPALPVADTLKRNDEGYAGDIISRENISIIQTPQGFAFTDIFAAHKAAQANGVLDLTDDSEVAARAGIPVRIVDGDQDNIKITNPDDFKTARQILEYQENRQVMQIRTGSGFDVHKFGPGGFVTLCGVKIPHSRGLAGHSDADVGLHALVDAILGALGAGDIGSHFPPSDAKWKDADSALFLEHACNLVREKSGRINHVDVTLICEEPKIDPQRDTMRQRVANIMEIPVSRVSVKATTSEGLGFTGRSEGIAAQAIATIALPDREQ